MLACSQAKPSPLAPSYLQIIIQLTMNTGESEIGFVTLVLSRHIGGVSDA